MQMYKNGSIYYVYRNVLHPANSSIYLVAIYILKLMSGRTGIITSYNYVKGGGEG